MLSPGKSTILVVLHLWAGIPQTGSLGFGFLAQPLELVAVGVREGGGAGESQFDEVLVEEVLVLPVAVRIQVDVSQCPPIGVLGVADAGYLQSDDALREDALCVVGCLRPEATDCLIGSYGLGGVHAYESHRGAAALGLYRDGVAVGHLRYPAIELVRSEERRVGKECRSRWSPYH